MMFMRFVFLCWIFILPLVAAPRLANQHNEVQLSLDLLEQVLMPIASGGSLESVSRITRAIVQGTQGAHRSIQEIAAMREGIAVQDKGGRSGRGGWSL